MMKFKIYITSQLERFKIMSEVKLSRGALLRFGFPIIMLRQAGVESFPPKIFYPK